MSTLERHCRMLLRAYPASYRDVRAEEIIGTLLEMTPPGRSWPVPRDVRGLAFSGLRARALFNRQLTTAANLRVAVLAGVAAYLAYRAATYLGLAVLAEVLAPGRQVGFGWPILLTSAFTILAVGLVFLTSRRAVVLAAVLPAAALAGYTASWRLDAGYHLALLAALVALARRSNRPSRRWLVLVGLLAVLPVVPDIEPLVGPVHFGVLLLAVGGISLVWAVIDARPAIAVLVFCLGLYLPIAASELTMGAIPVFVLPYLAVLTGIVVAAVWLLRRQSAHRSPPTRIS